MNALGVYLLVSLFFVVASFIEFGVLLMLIRAQLLDGRTNTGENKTDEDFQTYEGPISAKMLNHKRSAPNG